MTTVLLDGDFSTHRQIYDLGEEVFSLKHEAVDVDSWLTLSNQDRLLVPIVQIVRGQLERLRVTTQSAWDDALVSIELEDIGVSSDWEVAWRTEKQLLHEAFLHLVQHRAVYRAVSDDISPAPNKSDIQAEWGRDPDEVDWGSEYHLVNFVVMLKVREENGYTPQFGYEELPAHPNWNIENFIRCDELSWSLTAQLANLSETLTMMAAATPIGHSDSPSEAESNVEGVVSDTPRQTQGTYVYGPAGMYPETWTEVAREIRRRDDYECKNCGSSDIELHVHHVVPLAKGGTNRASNLLTLCKLCHELVHPHMRYEPSQGARWKFWRS